MASPQNEQAPLYPEQPELVSPWARDQYEQSTRLQEVYRIARALLIDNQRYSKLERYPTQRDRHLAKAWSQIAELPIDSRFFFAFDPHWHLSVRSVRHRFLGHEDTPLNGLSDAQRWYKSLNSTEKEAFDEQIIDLAGRFGLPSDTDVAHHVLFGQALWIPARQIERGIDLSHPVPAIIIRIYSASELRYLMSQAPLLFDGLDKDQLLNSLPYSLDDLNRFPGMVRNSDRSLDVVGHQEMLIQEREPTLEEIVQKKKELQKWADETTRLEESAQQPRRLQAAITPGIRIRTWAIYYMSTDGGGPLSWARTGSWPIAMWNEMFPNLNEMFPKLELDEFRTNSEYWPRIEQLQSQVMAWRARTVDHWAHRKLRGPTG